MTEQKQHEIELRLTKIESTLELKIDQLIEKSNETNISVKEMQKILNKLPEFEGRVKIIEKDHERTEEKIDKINEKLEKHEEKQEREMKFIFRILFIAIGGLSVIVFLLQILPKLLH